MADSMDPVVHAMLETPAAGKVLLQSLNDSVVVTRQGLTGVLAQQLHHSCYGQGLATVPHVPSQHRLSTWRIYCARLATILFIVTVFHSPTTTTITSLIHIYVYMYTCSFIVHILPPIRRFIYYSLRVYSLFYFKYCLFCVYTVYIFINLFFTSFLNLFINLFIF